MKLTSIPLSACVLALFLNTPISASQNAISASSVASKLKSGVKTIYTHSDGAASAFAALKIDGSVVTWGISSSGGDSSAVASKLTGVKKIYPCAYNAFAALKEDGAVVVWGNSAKVEEANKVAADLSAGVKELFFNTDAALAWKEDGTIVTWGNSTNGGDSNSVTVKLHSGVEQIVSFPFAFAARKGDGSVVLWGNANQPPLQNWGSIESQLFSGVKELKWLGPIWNDIGHGVLIAEKGGSQVRIQAQNFTNKTATSQHQTISANASTAELLSNGSVVQNQNTDKGVVSFDSVSELLNAGVVSISASYSTFAALKDDKSVVTWGDGDGADSSTVKKELSSGVVKIYNGGPSDWFLALKDNGALVFWGTTGWKDKSYVPSKDIKSKLTSGVTQISASTTNDSWTFAALKKDGSVVTWGDFTRGGDSGAVADKLRNNVKEIYSNNFGFAALKEDGSVVTWGEILSSGRSGNSTEQPKKEKKGSKKKGKAKSDLTKKTSVKKSRGKKSKKQ
jgi:hypothetical protein